MRGVSSNGMLCSGSELAITDDADGLLILARAGEHVKGVEPGASVAALLCHADEVVFDLAIEPNRPDALSIIGVARDIAAHLKLAFQIPEPEVLYAKDGQVPALDAPVLRIDEPGAANSSSLVSFLA